VEEADMNEVCEFVPQHVSLLETTVISDQRHENSVAKNGVLGLGRPRLSASAPVFFSGLHGIQPIHPGPARAHARTFCFRGGGKTFLDQ
jgi:hypothetical protein